MSGPLAGLTLPLAQVLHLHANADKGQLSPRAQVIAVLGTVLFLVFVIELVRRRRLIERYALGWILVATVGVVLAVWNGGLNWLAARVGIDSPTNALFLVGLVAIFGLLLNFSAAISRLSEETKILAQTVSRLDAELRQLRGEGPPARNGNGTSAHDEAEAVAGPAEDGSAEA